MAGENCPLAAGEGRDPSFRRIELSPENGLEPGGRLEAGRQTETMAGTPGAQSRQTRSPGSLREVRSAGGKGVADGPPTPTELRAERRCQAASLAAAKGTAVRLGVT